MLPISFLVIVTVSLFTNTFWSEFTYDDSVVILENPEVKYWHLGNLWGWWSRSTRTLSLMIDYHFFGESPAGYHIQNIVWHLSSVILLYVLFLKLSADRLVSFLTALLFAIHPIHVEAVANIANRKEMLCMTFSLLSFLSYIRFIEEKEVKRWIWLIGSILLWYIALNSKQVAVVLPFSIVVYEAIFLPKEKRAFLKKPILLFTCLTIASLLILSFEIKEIEITKGSLPNKVSLFSAFITSAEVFWKYVQLLFFPLKLSPDYVVEPSTSLTKPLTALSWAALIGMVFLPFGLTRRNPIVSFALLWFVVHFIPVSGAAPKAYFMADRYMYIPSAGICLLIAYAGKEGYNKLCRYDKHSALIVSAIIITTVVAAYSIRTIKYNQTWQNQMKLWSYTIKVSPKSFIAYYNRGNLYNRLDDHKQAISDYGKAIEIAPKFTDAYYNRGTAYESLSNYEQAINDFKNIIEINPMDTGAYYELGMALNKTGEKGQALSYIKKAASLGHKDARAYLQD